MPKQTSRSKTLCVPSYLRNPSGQLCAYICVCTESYPQGAGLTAMSMLSSAVTGLKTTSAQVKAEAVKAKGLNKHLQPVYRELNKRYANADDSSSILRAKATVKKVTAKMVENIDKALVVVADTQQLMETAEELASETEETSTDAKHWHKHKKCCCHMFDSLCGRHKCLAKCFMSFVSLVFVLLGLGLAALAAYTIVVLEFGGENVLKGYTSATVLIFLIVGIVLAVTSMAVWGSSLKPTGACSKIVSTNPPECQTHAAA